MTVSTFNKRMAGYFNKEPKFHSVHVKGEVSGTFISQVGHLYFTLKDKSSQIPCIVYRDNRKDIGFDIEDGMKLLVTANVGVYWPHGKYQLDVRSVVEDGLGQLYVKLQQLKKKLAAEGLFEEEHKKELPSFPNKIGVITSLGGSVIHDIIKTVQQKWPYCQVILFPAAVQGANSKNELVTQIRRADDYGMDVLIVARGGGSLEDLWSYNEEIVVRTIFECRTPVISAIGHEDDTTLSDLAADVQASTPTMAASLAIEDRNHVFENISHFNSKLITFMSSKVDDYKKQLEFLLSKPIFSDSNHVYKSKRTDFDELFNRFDSSSSDLLDSNRIMLEKITNEYVIRHPCKLQLDSSRSNLNQLNSRLIDAMNSIVNGHKVNLDKAVDKFKFQSDMLLTSKKHSLEILKSYLKTNPCQNQINNLKDALEVEKLNLNREMALKLENDRKELNHILQRGIIKNPKMIYSDKSKEWNALNDKFVSRANEIISANGYRLASVKSAPAIKNHLNEHIVSNNDKISNFKSRLEKSYNLTVAENKNDLNFILNNNLFKKPEEILYQSKKEELEKIKSSKTIQNPYVMLDGYKNELKIYEEKLDKINQVITLKKEQQKQKATYIRIIVAIVVVLIIILIVMFGGII